MIPDFKLSKHITFYDMTNTRHVGLQISNREQSVPHLFEMRDFACSILDIARELIGPFIVTSGYRSIEVNSWVGGVSNSSHTRGLAADILRPEWTFKTCSEAGWMLFEHLKLKGIKAKIIIEAKEGAAWLHINSHTELVLYEGLAGKYTKLA